MNRKFVKESIKDGCRFGFCSAAVFSGFTLLFWGGGYISIPTAIFAVAGLSIAAGIYEAIDIYFERKRSYK